MGKKSKKNKIPKKIAGVKVPKELRKAGNRLAKLAEEPVAQEIALAALAAGLAARKDARKAAMKAAEEGSEAVADSGGWLAAALSAAATEAGRRIVEAIDETAKEKGGQTNVTKLIEVAGKMAGGGKR